MSTMTVPLPNVDIFKFYNLCAVYVLERSGSRRSLEDLLSTYGRPFLIWDDIDVGDILVWNVKEQIYKDYATQIVGSSIITPTLRINKHFGVMENNGFVSDLAFTKDEFGNQHPFIRMRSCIYLRDPDYVVKRIDAVQES